MVVAFDMQTELANLAARIAGPVAANLTSKELDTVVHRIRHAFEKLSSKSHLAQVDFHNTAVNILEPVGAKLNEANFARIVDRLRGAMVEFCQRDGAKHQLDAEPSELQQAGHCETLDPQQGAHSQLANADAWWSTSEQAMWLLILFWLCTARD